MANFLTVGRRELRFGPWVRYGISPSNLAFRTLWSIHKKRKRQVCRLWMAPYENLLKCSFWPVRDLGKVEIAIQVFYERLRDYKVNLSYSKWEVSVIT